MAERYKVNYAVGADNCPRRESFDIFAHGRREAAVVAKGKIEVLYPDLVYEISRCSRTAIEILGKDVDGDVFLKSLVARYQFPDD